MRKTLPFGALALLTGSLFAADTSPKDDVIGAAKKLGEKGNYSWKTSVENAGGGGGGGGGGRGGGPTEGKTEKDGFTMLSMTRGENTTQSVLKGGKGAIKTQDGWKSLTEAAEDQGQNSGRFMARTLQNFKAPAAQAEDIAGKIKQLKKDGDVYSGDLTDEGAKALATFGGGRGGGGGANVSNAKGSAKFWVKDGVLTKYQYNVKANVSFNNNDREVDRTTTTEIKDVGSTKVEVPEDAKKKLS